MELCTLDDGGMCVASLFAERYVSDVYYDHLKPLVPWAPSFSVRVL